MSDDESSSSGESSSSSPSSESSLSSSKEASPPPKLAAKSKGSARSKKRDDDEEDEFKGAKRGRTTKKDPNAPKRPMSSYFIYANAQRARIQQQNPGIKITEVTKKASEEWKVLTADQKKEWDDKAKLDKARYDNQMKSYVPPNNVGGPKKKAKKDPNAPKQAQNAYMFFVNEFREKNKTSGGSQSVTEMSKRAGEAWRGMSPADKKPYEERSAADKIRAARELEAYKRGETVHSSSSPPPQPAPVAEKPASPASPAKHVAVEEKPVEKKEEEEAEESEESSSEHKPKENGDAEKKKEEEEDDEEEEEVEEDEDEEDGEDDDKMDTSQ